MSEQVNKPGAGKGGVVPPEHTRWKPGQSGNPGGSRTAGAWIKEWYNAMASWDEKKLRAVLKDTSAPVAKVTAAQEWLRARDPRLLLDEHIEAHF